MRTFDFINNHYKDFYSKCNGCEYNNGCSLKAFFSQIDKTGLNEQLMSSDMYKKIDGSLFLFEDTIFSAICGLQKDKHK